VIHAHIHFLRQEILFFFMNLMSSIVAGHLTRKKNRSQLLRTSSWRLIKNFLIKKMNYMKAFLMTHRSYYFLFVLFLLLIRRGNIDRRWVIIGFHVLTTLTADHFLSLFNVCLILLLLHTLMKEKILRLIKSCQGINQWLIFNLIKFHFDWK